ncbi:MAG: molybdopterin cofactor-binding domain-containing protein, partial [Nitrososphaerales archaeon]
MCQKACGSSRLWKQINPRIVEGQVHGSIAQAMCACLFEEVVYDSQGQLQSGSFLDYLLPTAESIPEL